MFSCKFCNKIGKNANSHRNHERLCKLNPDRDISFIINSQEKRTASLRTRKERGTFRNQWDNPDYQISEETRKKHGQSGSKVVWSEEKRRRHSESMKRAVQQNPESYTKNNVCGRVKIIDYNGVKLKGSWEVKVAQWLDSQAIIWESEVNPQSYFWNNGWHLYFPDFYLPDYDVYIEVKGYKTLRDDAKWAQFNGILKIIDSTNIDSFINITIKEFLSLVAHIDEYQTHNL